MRLLLVLSFLLTASVGAQGVEPVDRYDRPAHSVTLDLGGAYDLGIGVGGEVRVLDGLALRGEVGLPGSLFGSRDAVSFGEMAVGLVGVRWVEAEAGLGLSAVVGESEASWTPAGYGGLRLSLPLGRDQDGETVPRDIVLRSGVFLSFWKNRGVSYNGPLAFPSLSAGIAF